MADKTVRVGIIGAGIWGTNHALALTTHPGARWPSSAIATGSGANAGERFGCAWTTNLDDVAASESRP